jgi:hypothetical protein
MSQTVEVDDSAGFVLMLDSSISKVSPQHFCRSILSWHLKSFGSRRFASEEILQYSGCFKLQRQGAGFPIFTIPSLDTYHIIYEIKRRYLQASKYQKPSSRFRLPICLCGPIIPKRSGANCVALGSTHISSGSRDLRV